VEGRRPEDPQLVDGLPVVASQGLNQGAVGEVTPEAVQVQPGQACDLLDHGPVVEIQPFRVARLQQCRVEVVEAALEAAGLGGVEGQAALRTRIVRGGAPNRPALLLVVHLCEGEVAPAQLEVAGS